MIFVMIKILHVFMIESKTTFFFAFTTMIAFDIKTFFISCSFMTFSSSNNYSSSSFNKIFFDLFFLFFIIILLSFYDVFRHVFWNMIIQKSRIECHMLNSTYSRQRNIILFATIVCFSKTQHRLKKNEFLTFMNWYRENWY
jgi:hypothetical protein